MWGEAVGGGGWFHWSLSLIAFLCARALQGGKKHGHGHGHGNGNGNGNGSGKGVESDETARLLSDEGPGDEDEEGDSAGPCGEQPQQQQQHAGIALKVFPPRQPDASPAAGGGAADLLSLEDLEGQANYSFLPEPEPEPDLK